MSGSEGRIVWLTSVGIINALYPTESCLNYKEMLLDLKTRGLEQVLLFISDGLVGLPDAVTDVFPKAQHQSCWTHLQRNVSRRVRAKDKAEITQAVKLHLSGGEPSRS